MYYVNQIDTTSHTCKDPLIPQLTFLPLFLIIVANMVGSGIFTTSGFIIQDIQNPLGMLLCWLIGGLLALTGALCYGELGAMFPAAGGDYVFFARKFWKADCVSIRLDFPLGRFFCSNCGSRHRLWKLFQ